MKRSALLQHYPDEVHSWSRVATASGEDGDIRDRLVKLGLVPQVPRPSFGR